MRFHYVLGLASTLVWIGSLSAQNPPTQVNPAQAQPVQATPYPPALYQMKDVGTTLNLTQDQINRLNQLTNQTQAKYRDAYNKIEGLNQSGRIARAQELNRQYQNDWNKTAAEILNDRQYNRYRQLYHQYGGFNSFYYPDVQKRLNLTAEQMKNVRDVVDWDNRQLQGIRKVGATDSTKASQLYNAYWSERQKRIDTFLTPAQLKAWREITGQPYAFQNIYSQPR